ncbi:MAG: dimethyl sulfoxide reductase anchor subunit [Chloroflexi bacterium]|nr:dimethyl sulfoxide reductase anchor subunit [Chloroflexota bacterium]
MTYAFTFDSSACSGCKACQEACKDKNNLPVGVLWRRVIEVSGGGWHPAVGAGSPRPNIVDDVNGVGGPNPYAVWENTVFAYNLSIACNHCVHPKCAGVCPTDAYIHRSDGIVYIDSSKCMGCGYCSWACPYSAPRYNPELGQMSKCNFCFDNIDAGLPPSCVAACPMRVLNFVEVSTLSEVEGRMQLWGLPASEHPFPLPNNSRTEPHLAVKPHKGMSNSLEKAIANIEEIRPKKQKSEASLVGFTLLAQMSVGMAWAGLWMTDSLPLIPYLLIGVCLVVGGFFSFAHLGAKRNAWRASFHLKKSWLSREILTAGLFGVSWLAGMFVPEMRWATSLLGAAFIYSMAQVYRLHVMPTWDTWRTTAGFFVTAALLGYVAMSSLLGAKSGREAFVVLVLLAVELAMMLSAKPKAEGAAINWRMGLSAAALLGVGTMLFAWSPFGGWISPVLFLIVLIEEIIGRVKFYEALHQKAL